MGRIQRFKARLLAGEMLVGTWVKTPSPILVEVLGLTELDCICLDAEHAPFDRLVMDGCIFAARATDMPVFIRIPSASPAHILHALDCGGTGVFAPHVMHANDAKALARAAQYGPGGRGFAGSSRAASYTQRTMQTHLEAAAKEVTVVAQIEDVSALDAIEEIASVDGIDCLFIGRIDLTVALEAQSSNDRSVLEAVEKICRVGKEKNKRVGMFVSDIDEIPKWQALGATLFILQSDHTFLLQGGKALKQRFDSLTSDACQEKLDK